MVITTSAARTISSVHGFGYSPEMSIPRSAIASIAAGLISLSRLRATGPGDRAVAGEVLEEPERHLRPAGVVHAQEQHDRPAVLALALDLGQRS